MSFSMQGGGIFNSLSMKESADFKRESEGIHSSNPLIPPIPLIQSRVSSLQETNSSKEIEQELETTTNKMKEIRNKMREDINTQSSMMRKEQEQERLEDQINKMQSIYQQQITLLSNKGDILENELRFQTENNTSKIQMLEDENSKLIKDLQQKSQDLALALETIEEYKVLLEQYQEERQKNNEKVKSIDEGYKFLEAEMNEQALKCTYFEKQKNKYKRERNDAREQLSQLKEENALLEEITNKQKQEIQFLTLNVADQENKLDAFGSTEQNYSELQTKFIEYKKQIDEDSLLISQYDSNLKQIQQQYEMLQKQYSNIILEKNAGEDRYLKQIQDLEEAIESTRHSLQKSESSSAKHKKKLTDVQSKQETMKIQIEKYEKLEEIYKTDFKGVCRALEKCLSSSSSSQIPIRESDSPIQSPDSDVMPLISMMKNIVQNIKKEIKQKDSQLSKRKDAVSALTTERDNINSKLEQQKVIFKEKEATFRKEYDEQSEKISEISKNVLNLQNENNQLKRGISDLQISYSNFQEMTKDKESVVYQKIAIKMMNYCGLLHSKLAHLKLIKNMLWSLANIYLQSSETILKLNARYLDREELQDTIKSPSSVKEAKLAKKKKRQRKLRIAFVCTFFIGLLKVKKNTKLLLPQGLICNWITCANRTNLVEQVTDKYNIDEVFKNPDKFIISMNSNSDMLNFKDNQIQITGNLRQQLLQLEQFYHKSTQSDRDQIDFFNKKTKEISSQLKLVVDSRSEFEDRLKQQIYLNKSQQITIQQLQGEISDLQFELKLQNRNKNHPYQNQQQSKSHNVSNYLK